LNLVSAYKQLIIAILLQKSGNFNEISTIYTCVYTYTTFINKIIYELYMLHSYTCITYKTLNILLKYINAYTCIQFIDTPYTLF